jgi:crotonobetainyl-CoA:carnitine CoA-transferase CaiB-like acyl-CoA transferase
MPEPPAGAASLREGAPPLTGLRVVDLSRVLAGPYCTMVLADLGADVVKVERPEGGDETRAWGPPFAGGESAYYLSVNRGKRSCAIDLGHPDGRALALELCERADVVIENFKSGGAERLGLGYETLRERNPGLVHCSITGFGSDRRPADRPGYDFVAQAESGFMSITGFDQPTKVGVAVVDVLAGLNAAIAVLAALRTGEGGHLEVPLLDAGIAALVNQALNALVTGEDPIPRGNAHPNIVPYGDFATAEGRLVLAAANDGLFRRLCKALERPELAEDPRFATNPARVEHRDELKPELERSLSTRSADDWVEVLGSAGVPVGKVRTISEAVAAAAAAGVPVTARVPHPTAGEVELVRSPIRTELREPRAPPLLGQHTAEVLRELERSEEEIERLVARGVIALAG